MPKGKFQKEKYKPGVLNMSIAIYQSISEVLWVGRMTLTPWLIPISVKVIRVKSGYDKKYTLVIVLRDVHQHRL